MQTITGASVLGEWTAIVRNLPNPHDKSAGDVEVQNLRLIEMLGRPEKVGNLLADLLGDSSALAEVGGRSYRHVNHFDKIVLVDSDLESAYRLTLHLWRPPYTEDEIDDELIHDHRFSFWSTILTGTLQAESFRHASGGREYRQYQYVPERATRTNFYEFVGDAVLTSNGVSERPAGQSYRLAYTTIHRVQLPLVDMTSTLVLRGPRERRHSNVFNTTYPEADTRMTNNPFTAGELASRLSDLRQSLAM